MSTLKVNKLRDTAGSADAIVLDPNGGAVLAGVTTMTTARVTSGIVTNTFIVGAGVTISESGIEASGIGITCASINGTQIGGRRNIIINGSTMVAQRGTSSTSTGYQTVDRFAMSFSGEDEDPTQAQVDLSSSDTPYSSGFRKAFKITNGDQTSTGGSDFMALLYKIEAQDIANSGWNYTDPNSNLTIQFWAKSSVGKTFIISFYAADGTPRQYNHKYTLAANTWTKVIHTIPGSSTLVFDNNNALGLQLEIFQYIGTNLTSGSTVDQWVTYVGSSSTPDDTDDWWTTNDATFEITGLQLEVGSQATPFEHRSFGEELLLCQRYYQEVRAASITAATGNAARFNCPLLCEMRAEPSVGKGGSGNFNIGDMVSYGEQSSDTPSSDGYSSDKKMMSCNVGNFTGGSLTAYRTYCHEPTGSALALVSCSAEL